MAALADELVAAAGAVLDVCARAGATVATAESCTGGLIAAALTAIPGSSAFVDRGVVVYSNAAKSDLLGVPSDTIARDGAVSETVARAMADGLLVAAPVSAGVAVTGIAGPGGGSAAKPVGLVHVAAAARSGARLHERHRFNGDRDAVRLAAALAAMRLLIRVLEA